MTGAFTQEAGTLKRDLIRVASGLAPALRVIPGREAALLDALRCEVARLDKACAELAATLAGAREEAVREGRAAGYAEGRADAAALVAEALRFRDGFCDRAADEGVDMAFAVAARLVGRELVRDPALYRACVESWRARTCGGAPCEVTLSPENTELFWDGGAPPEGVRVVPDPSLSRGTCRIEWADGAVETGFDLAWEELRRACR